MLLVNNSTRTRTRPHSDCVKVFVDFIGRVKTQREKVCTRYRRLCCHDCRDTRQKSPKISTPAWPTIMATCRPQKFACQHARRVCSNLTNIEGGPIVAYAQLARVVFSDSRCILVYKYKRLEPYCKVNSLWRTRIHGRPLRIGVRFACNCFAARLLEK